MPTVLLVAPYFLPRRRVGAMRPLRFAIHLREFGWDPVVMTIASRGSLTTREAELLEGVPVVELRPPFDLTGGSESQLGGEEGRGAGGRRLLRLPLPVDGWLPFFLSAYGRILREVRRIRPDAVWSTGDPWSGLVITERFCRRLGIPWIADFRDPWTICRVRSRGRGPILRAMDRHFEGRVLRGADAILFQATETERRYRERFAELGLRTRTITNSFDEALLADPVFAGGAPPPVPGDQLHIGFFGRFREMSPAGPMIQALAEAGRRQPEPAAAVHVHSFGPLNAADQASAEAHGLADRFHAEEAVPLEEALSALRRFDILLLSTHPDRDEIIPAKLLEYLAVGRPILSLSPNPEVAGILEETGTGVQLPVDDAAGLADLLVACAGAKREGRRLPIPFACDQGRVAAYEARATTRQLADLLESIVR